MTTDSQKTKNIVFQLTKLLIEEKNKISQLESKLLFAKTALEFYSGVHEPSLTNPNDGPWGVDSTDFGSVARIALDEIGT